MARIAVTDGMDKKAVTMLQKAGHQVVLESISAEDLAAGALAEFDAIIVRSATKLNAAVIAASGDRLKVIGRAGVGVDNIDLEAAGERGIPVVNAPRGDFTSEGLMLKERVVLHGVLNQPSKLTDGQRARGGFVTR